MPDPTDDDILKYVVKQSVILQISDEALYGPRNPRPGHMEPPTADELAAYNTWKQKFHPLFKEGERRGWFREGDEMDGFEYTPPESRWVFDSE